jgi:hypothetical protein
VAELEIIWPGCLELAKRSLAKLVDILIEEQGIQRSSIKAVAGLAINLNTFSYF